VGVSSGAYGKVTGLYEVVMQNGEQQIEPWKLHRFAYMTANDTSNIAHSLTSFISVRMYAYRQTEGAAECVIDLARVLITYLTRLLTITPTAC